MTAAACASASAAAAGAAQHRADARDHLGAAERLDDVVVGAELEADDPVGLRAARGQHHDRDVAAAPQRAADVAAVAVGQGQVEQHDVGLDLVGELERLAAVAATNGSKPSRASAFENGSEMPTRPRRTAHWGVGGTDMRRRI